MVCSGFCVLILITCLSWVLWKMFVTGFMPLNLRPELAMVVPRVRVVRFILVSIPVAGVVRVIRNMMNT